METMKTYMAKPGELAQKWHLIDARGKVLGRLASEVARILRGKDKPEFTPHVDTGDFVIVINAAAIRLTGNKVSDKVYYHHTGYPGGIKSMTAGEMLEKKPEEVVNLAVKGMLPKNKLGRKLMKKLKVYPGSDHRHEAQKPVAREI
jgi:large subunit ribosomal protein L13